MVAHLKENPRFNARGLDDYLRQSLARSMCYYPLGPEANSSSPIGNGLAIRLLIGYPDVKFTPLKPGSSTGNRGHEHYLATNRRTP